MTVSVSTGEKGLEISYGDSRSFMQVLPAAEFPALKNEEGDDYFEIKESDFKTLIAKTVFCCATDESRPILKGCLLEAGDGQAPRDGPGRLIAWRRRMPGRTAAAA